MNRLPNVTFKIRSQNEFETGEMCYLEGDKAWMSISSSDLFSEKRVLIFEIVCNSPYSGFCESKDLCDNIVVVLKMIKFYFSSFL